MVTLSFRVVLSLARGRGRRNTPRDTGQLAMARATGLPGRTPTKAALRRGPGPARGVFTGLSRQRCSVAKLGLDPSFSQNGTSPL